MPRQGAATLRQRQRGVFVAHQLRQSLMRLPDPFSNPHFSEQDTNRQGVDEYTQGAIGPLSPLHAAEQHGAEHYVLAARQATQYLGPYPMEYARGADTHRSCMLADASGYVRFQPLLHLPRLTAVSMH